MVKIKTHPLKIKNMICSVLAGYVWDTTNPYVKDHENGLQKLARLIELRDKLKASATQP